MEWKIIMNTAEWNRLKDAGYGTYLFQFPIGSVSLSPILENVHAIRYLSLPPPPMQHGRAY